MRRLSAATQSTIASSRTAPLYLIEILLPIPRRLSTRETVEWSPLAGAPLLWTESGASVTFGPPGPGGSGTAEITLPNHTRDWYPSALSLSRAPARVNIVQLYGSGPFQPADGEVLFEGITDAVPKIADTIRISCVTDGADTAYSPRLPVQALAPSPRHAGDIITWGAVDIELSGQK